MNAAPDTAETETALPAGVSAETLASLYGVPTYSIIGMADRGKLPGIKIGPVWRFHECAVEEALTAARDNYRSQAAAAATPAYVSSITLSKRYEVTARTITGLAEKGEIPAIKIGGQWRFDPEAVHATLTSHTTQPFTQTKVRRPRRTSSPPSAVATSNACPAEGASK